MEEQRKMPVPTMEELVRWHDQFARMLKPNEDGTKLFGVDGKRVIFLRRSSPCWVTLTDLPKLEDSLGYCIRPREDGSESCFRVDSLNGDYAYLNYAECDFVLGTNYYVIDEGYSSPSPGIRRVLFRVDDQKRHGFNAFEIGNIESDGRYQRIPVLYYKISPGRFEQLKNWRLSSNRWIRRIRAEREKQ